MSKHKKMYLLENVYSKVKTILSEQEIIDLANSQCRFFESRHHWFPIDSIQKAIDYYQNYSFRVRTLKFKD